MALLTNPFVANVPRQLSTNELLQALRVDVVGEYAAVISYEAHAQATDNQQVKQVLLKLADDERKHIGQLQELLSMLDPTEEQLIAQGKQVVQQAQSPNSQQQLQ